MAAARLLTGRTTAIVKSQLAATRLVAHWTPRAPALVAVARLLCTAPNPSTMATPSSPKRMRPTPRIVTHSGTFHADEVLACHMLRVLPEYKDAEILRSRDAAVWATASVLVDVGAEYVPAQHKYDHHQREFQDTFSPAHKIRLSSAGLVYKHFGARVIATLLSLAETDPRVALVHAKLYDDLIEAFDAIDNGVSRYPVDAKPAYRDATSLSSVVSKLNPFWNEPATDADVLVRFEEAMSIVGAHFDRCVRYLGLAWAPARTMVEDALAQVPVRTASTTPAHAHILVMEQYCPWKDHLHTLEPVASHAVTAPIPEGAPVPTNVLLYVVFPDTSGSWRVQAIAVRPDAFESRKPLPSKWRGLRDAALDALTGVPGGVFIHASGFIGGHKTREGAIKLAEMAVEM
ncbi:hypothetical protein AMAG_10987 [Allomyces macrogynus ATCC 38327]|uniref:Uncharacterized protein n=1 Tax=Allomyces macrogynus (strain ATCC 38327) TaxID=578462 RepID=A0A0L0SSI8_ALLM3|nr:hypothetical protein AMAG_10987 [Allomyces macrogynus ATCC 38327]|eukprot:KNE65345.1 hypothetical protein AMAG_10987 [Allomyces macrogynus ATCC 38327]